MNALPDGGGMILIFDEVPDEGLAIDCRLDLPEVVDDRGGSLVRGPVRLVGRACHGAGGLELTADLAATLVLQCSRCLDSLEHAIRVDFSLILVSQAVEFGVGEAQTAPGDARIFYGEQGRADLRVVCAEQIYLNLPSKAVCGEACSGLCPTCGANRNRIECGCRTDDTSDMDQRFAPLLALKKKNGESEA